MINVCRVCLSADPTMDILQISLKQCNDSFVDVMLFCLGIKVNKLKVILESSWFISITSFLIFIKERGIYNLKLENLLCCENNFQNNNYKCYNSLIEQC